MDFGNQLEARIVDVDDPGGERGNLLAVLTSRLHTPDETHPPYPVSVAERQNDAALPTEVSGGAQVPGSQGKARSSQSAPARREADRWSVSRQEMYDDSRM
jgi:hypothetical protein